MKEILNKLIWHPNYDISKAKIWYISRGMPDDLDFIMGDEIEKLEPYYVKSRKAIIPYHRIVKIEYEGRVIFSRI
ncbi:MAG: DUF504 domain-containing protein [Thermoplasmata archaeon]|nr:DUF504 domain-containing protein [Thermoplasmata archaeon]